MANGKAKREELPRSKATLEYLDERAPWFTVEVADAIGMDELRRNAA